MKKKITMKPLSCIIQFLKLEDLWVCFLAKEEPP
jgi:hypothetical protein